MEKHLQREILELRENLQRKKKKNFSMRFSNTWKQNLEDDPVKKLNAADDREASKEAHVSSNLERRLYFFCFFVFSLFLSVFFV